MASFTRIRFVKSENQIGIWQFNITDKELVQLGIEYLTQWKAEIDIQLNLFYNLSK